MKHICKCNDCGYWAQQWAGVCPVCKCQSLESKVQELSRLAEHGNGPVLLGWMDAHKKAMDKLEVAEEKISRMESARIEALNLLGGNIETDFEKERYFFNYDSIDRVMELLSK